MAGKAANADDGTPKKPAKRGRAPKPSTKKPAAKKKPVRTPVPPSPTAKKGGGKKAGPEPKVKAGDEKYDAHRERMAEKQRTQSASGRDIGSIPAVADPARRARCAKSLKLFARTYFPRRFRLAFGSAHDVAIEREEECILHGGLFACAMPRGAGKTTIAEVAVLWAVLYGYRQFAVLLCAILKLATRRLKQLVKELETNDLLLADFPEACFPVRALGRIHGRAKGQTCCGRPTRIEITADGIILPDIPGSPSAGAVIQVAGMEGAIRGLNVAGPDGEPLRPDIVLLDDCQTRDSAKSPTQTADREAVVMDDVLGLAGPDTAIAAVMLCTVIYPNDLSDRFLNPDRHPEWQGLRTKMLEAFPADMGQWDEYAEIRRHGMRAGDKGQAGNDYYRARRAAMDLGARVSWEGRVKKGDVSAIQTAMNAYYDNPRGFAAEMQNEPLVPAAAAGAKDYRPADVAARTNGVPQLEVPPDCNRLTAFIDCGSQIIWYAVSAWNDKFGGGVIDYGTFPRQNRAVFAGVDPRPSLADVFPRYTEEQRLYAALEALVPAIFGRAYRRVGSGHELHVERGLIDSGWLPATVYEYIAASPYAALLYPSKGVGRSNMGRGVGAWQVRDGEKGGHHWRLTAGERRGSRLLQFDPNPWKSFVHGALTLPPGDGTGLKLFGKTAAAHELFAEHIAAEGSVPVKSVHGDWFDQWGLLPDRDDNHWLDCVVGTAVAASVQGLQIPSTLHAVPVTKRQRKRIDIEELYKAQQQQGVSG